MIHEKMLKPIIFVNHIKSMINVVVYRLLEIRSDNLVQPCSYKSFILEELVNNAIDLIFHYSIIQIVIFLQNVGIFKNSRVK